LIQLSLVVFSVDDDWKIVDYQHRDFQYKVIVDLLPVRKGRGNCEIVENCKQKNPLIVQGV